MIKVSDILTITIGIIIVVVTGIIVESIIKAFLPVILTLITQVQKYFPLISLIPILIILIVIFHELKFG
ncbi:MAG: hypothetical protein C0180_01640 [Aciduliprofundum sp.]|nr:MAG: hypothetical protein C0180_01640 [Aciduliprofundum sp.]